MKFHNFHGQNCILHNNAWPGNQIKENNQVKKLKRKLKNLKKSRRCFFLWTP